MEVKPDTIKVVASQREEIRATQADLSVVVKDSLLFSEHEAMEESAEVRQFVDELIRFGLPAEAVQMQTGIIDRVGETSSPEALYRLHIRCEKPEQIGPLLALINSRRNVSLENAEWQYPEEAQKRVIERAITKANANARKVADSLGVRLLGVHKLDENIAEEESPAPEPGSGRSKTIEARVEIEYRVSGFSQSRVDFMTIRTSRNVTHLLRKEFSTRWFRFGFWLKSRRFKSKDDLPAISPPKRALVAGHFSIPGGGGTFGDLEAKDMVCQWLSDANIEFDVASNNEDGFDGLKIDLLDETKYGIFIFVCGPWYPAQSIPSMLLAKFKHCVKIGVNLTVFERGNAGFDYLLPRDRLDEMRADIAFGKKVNLLPVAGVLLIERQQTYGIRQRHRFVKQIISEYIQAGEVAPIWLDTVANHNIMGIKTGRQFESILRRTDFVITNRLHGLVLGLKNSVPVIAIDAVAGGGKVTAQAKALGWPLLIAAEDLSVEKLRESARLCLGSNLASDIQKSQQQAFSSIEETKDQFIDILHKIKSS